MNERGDALIETALIAPVLLFIGLLATEFGVSAINRSQLSETIRSTVNMELVGVQSSDEIYDGRTIEVKIGEKLKALSSIDLTRSLKVTVRLIDSNNELSAQLPFNTPQGETVLTLRPKEIEVRVRAWAKPLFGNFLTIPPLDEFVTYRLRG